MDEKMEQEKTFGKFICVNFFFSIEFEMFEIIKSPFY